MTHRTVITSCIAAVLALAVPAAASAQVTFRPTRFDDPPVGPCLPTDCSLREAVDEPVGPEARTIVLKPGVYELTQGLPLDLDNNAGITIQGAGARATTIDANNGSRVVSVIEGNDLAVINDVTITGGNSAAGSQSSSIGGGIWIDVAASLALNRSAVTGNKATLQGGGIYAVDNLVVTDSTIAGNQVGAVEVSAQGAGIYSGGGGNVTLTNTTVSGNVVAAGSSTPDGGGIYSAGLLQLMNVTIAGNSAANAFFQGQANLAPMLWNTIVASATGAACAGMVNLIAGDHNLDDDGSCEFGAAGDKPGVDPKLLGLTNNGGPTNTHALAFNSPAINAATALHCPGTDQRGVARPQLGACDIGAFEYRSPRLTVVKRVVNDHGGTLAAADFSVHVRAGAADVAGSPQPGTASGRTYTLVPGTYTVGEDADDRYAASLSGGCTANGTVTLAEGQAKTCMITNTYKLPVPGRSVNALPRSGVVKVKLPGSDEFVVLDEGDQIPVGTVVDTRKGRVTLVAASNKTGGTATADFYDGLFKLGQTKGKKPITVLTLVEKLTGCKGNGKASAAAKRKKKRRLWGDGRGRFRTKGRHSAATVVGTKWLVEDRCTSTLTRVVRGKVSVRDFVKHKTIIVRKGKRYIARAKG